MREALCSSCGVWPTAADDAFCPWCGAPCADIRLDLSSQVVQAGDFTPKLQLQVANPSCAALRINRVTAPPWIVIPGLRAGLELLPGSSSKIPVTVNSFDLTQATLGEIGVETNLGRRSVTVIAMEGLPVPRLDPPQIEVWSGPGSGTWKSAVKVTCESGYLKLIEILPPGENWMRASYSGGPAILLSDYTGALQQSPGEFVTRRGP